MKPKVCFGMTLYNNSRYLREAMESLLGQSYGDFHLVAVDDCSTDGTEELMRGYAKKEKRISYFRNDAREGLIATWRKAFFLAQEIFQPYYFAWASDHDIWHRDWLKHHVGTLNKYTNVVLAYPNTVPISATGEPLESAPSLPFETMKMSKIDRMYNLCRILRGSGDKVYGLFRVEPLMKAGVFRFLSMPDRLLLVEIGVYGPFKYIPDTLWQRRYIKPMESGDKWLDQQMDHLFDPRSVPFYAHFPYISHTLSLALSLGFFSRDNDDLRTGLLMSLMYWEANRDKTIEHELKKIFGAELEKYYRPAVPKTENSQFQKIEMILNMLYGSKSSLSLGIINMLLTEMIDHYSGSGVFAGPDMPRGKEASQAI